LKRRISKQGFKSEFKGGKVSGIVCAIRGGPASRPTIDKAIELASERGLVLYFLYVVNIDFLDHTIRSRVQTISQQMQQMGEFIILSAQATAQTKGSEAQGLVRHGEVTDEIPKLCHEIQADYLVVGRPKFHQEESHFTQTLLADFIKRVEEQTGAKVVLSEPSET
jgi:nucleotide-binding universal stress UspA family protein